MGKEGDDGNCRTCNSSACCSTAKLLLFMVPLVVISGLVCVFGLGTQRTVIISTTSTSISTLSPSSTLPPLRSSPLPPPSPPPPPPPSFSSVEASAEQAQKDDPEVARDNDGTVELSTVISKALIGDNGSSTTTPALSDTQMMKKRVLSNLEKIESELQMVRSAIKETLTTTEDQIHDPDYVPLGPIYWNAKAFHRSYLEMEKRFKIFVYKEGEPPLFHDGPCKSIYSMEGNFIHEMETSTRFRTRDPNKAHAFYLPFSVVKMVRFVYEDNSHDFGPIRKTVKDYIELVSGKYPYWNRTLGADHFILSCHDWGPEASFSHPYLWQNSIRALCNANKSEKFKPTKDVSIPEINLHTGTLTGLVGGPSPSRRPILAFFAGGVHGPIRPILLRHWENKDEDIRVHKYLPKGTSYSEMMRNSKFCICPSGYEVASPRIVEALYSGCVPVLINEGYVPPFGDVLNWRSFAVVVSVEEIPNLKKILMGISSPQYLRMYRRVLKVRRHFEISSPPKRFDVFHMILHSIWVRRLNVRIRELSL